MCTIVYHSACIHQALSTHWRVNGIYSLNKPFQGAFLYLARAQADEPQGGKDVFQM